MALRSSAARAFVQLPSTEAVRVWQAQEVRLYEVLSQAYNHFPGRSLFRRVMLDKAMDAADAALQPFVELPEKEQKELALNYAAIMSADAEGRRESVCDFIGCWLDVYLEAIERAYGGAA